MTGNVSLSARGFWHNLLELLEMIKFGHSVLALPFAFMGACAGGSGFAGRPHPFLHPGGHGGGPERRHGL